MSRLEVITGPMFSGKTEELLRRLSREEVAGRSIILFKPELDFRYGATKVVSHSGQGRDSCVAKDSWDIWETVINYPNPDVIGVDEGQFFDPGLADVLDQITDKGIKVIVCGLDKDFAKQDFGAMPRLMVFADRVDKLTAVCNKCGADDASFTQRLIDGKPAPWDGPTILVGGTESYEARCRDCFEPG